MEDEDRLVLYSCEVCGNEKPCELMVPKRVSRSMEGDRGRVWCPMDGEDDADWEEVDDD